MRIGLQTAFLFIFSLCLFSSILFWLHSTWCLIRLVLIHSPSDWLNTGCLKSANMGRPDYMCLCVWLWEIWMCLCETLFVVIVALMFVYLQVLVFVCMPVKRNSLLEIWPGVSQFWDITKIHPGRISFQKREKNIIQIQLLEYKVFYDGGVNYDWFFLTSFMDSLRLWSDLVDVIYMLWFFITTHIIL